MSEEYSSSPRTISWEEELRSFPNCQYQFAITVNEPPWNWIQEHCENLQLTVGLANILTTTSWEILSQNHSAGCFQIIESKILWKKNVSCWFWPHIVKLIYYIVIDNRPSLNEMVNAERKKKGGGNATGVSAILILKSQMNLSSRI